MEKEEYIETLVVGDHLIPVGLDDNGQAYFFEYMEAGELKIECCGTYNTDYKSYIEYKFGNPEKDCIYYDGMLMEDYDIDCPNGTKFGYCDKCPFQNREWSSFQELVKLNVIDRRGNINLKYKKFINSNNKGTEENGK